MSRSGPRPVNERLRRLLVMLPWLMEQGSVATADMAAHFGMSEKDLVADLTLASLCGVSQDPLDLIDVWVDEDRVHVGVPKYFDKPLRLTVPEAFSLVAAARAAQQLTGSDDSGALARAIVKVAGAVGFDPELDPVIELVAPEVLDPLVAACAHARVVEFDYWSVDSGESNRRRVGAVEVFGEGGHWYLRAWDSVAEREKTFRLDRLDGLVVTAEQHDVSLGARREWFESSEDVRLVRLEVDPAYLWMLERYPLVTIEDRTDRVRVSLFVHTQRWLSRLMLRFGEHARVLEPQEWTDVGARTAERVLETYR